MLNSIKISRSAGSLITLLSATVILFLFFHRQIFEANQVSFTSGGDGLKSTFGSLYHIEHDSGYWMFEGMNYPYGESIFYTGNQTFLTNLIKLCKEAGLDISAYTLGIFNLWMLFSFVICALLIYLILVDLGLPAWYAAAGSILITFLSPQWARMSGHYNLAYAWVIPLALYLMIRFYGKPRYWLSVIFGLFILVIGGKHVYFIALVGVPLVIFWLFLLIRSRSLYGKTAFLIPHFLIQFIVPVILFYLFVGSHDSVVDRTAYPWGFFSSTTRLVSVFLPLMKSYGLWINVGPVKTLGYVGIVSTIVFTVSIGLCILRWTRQGFKSAFIASDKFILNVFMLAGLICLIMALGYPFTWAHVLLNYTGPFRQFRAIGRFVIPFFYIMNIFTLAILWQWYSSMGKQWFRDFILTALVIMGFEAYSTIKDHPTGYYNKFETLNDRDNLTSDNRWVNNHDWTAYQAIMPMPYYHIGSENYWVGDGSPVTEESYIASLKTGLPLNSVMLSRTSISQTLANLDLYWEPGSDYPGLHNYKPGSPLLVVRHRNGRLNENEERIIGKSELIDSNSHMLFYRFYPDSLERILEEHACRMAEKADFIEGDTTIRWNYFETFDSSEVGLFSAEAKYYTEFAACSFPDSGKYLVSFWYEGAGRDLWPRTILYISLFDTLMNSYHYRRTDFFRETVQREKDWALVSVPVEVRNPGDHLKLHYINNILTGGEMVIDRVLVHAAADTILIRDAGNLLLNNRIVHTEH
jgi:hypothetical protein